MVGNFLEPDPSDWARLLDALITRGADRVAGPLLCCATVQKRLHVTPNVSWWLTFSPKPLVIVSQPRPGRGGLDTRVSESPDVHVE